MTIRQLAQADIKDELTKKGPKPRYRLGGDEFIAVDLVLPPGLFPTELTSISQVTFVGHIVTIEASGEKTRTVRMEDGTGKITSMTTEDQEAEQPQSLR